MELGGNKNAQLFYEENGMYKDGKPDHEAPLHSRQKAELSAKAEAAIRQEIEEAIGKYTIPTNYEDAKFIKTTR